MKNNKVNLIMIMIILAFLIVSVNYSLAFEMMDKKTEIAYAISNTVKLEKFSLELSLEGEELIDNLGKMRVDVSNLEDESMKQLEFYMVGNGTEEYYLNTVNIQSMEFYNNSNKIYFNENKIDIKKFIKIEVVDNRNQLMKIYTTQYNIAFDENDCWELLSNLGVGYDISEELKSYNKIRLELFVDNEKIVREANVFLVKYNKEIRVRAKID